MFGTVYLRAYERVYMSFIWRSFISSKVVDFFIHAVSGNTAANGKAFGQHNIPHK